MNRDFAAEAPNRKWTSDISDLPTWVYLAVVMDFRSRKIFGWSLSELFTTKLVTDVLRSAIEARRPYGKLLLHRSNRGCEYTSDAFQHMLRTLGIQCSMSRSGDYCDNATKEGFYWSNKHEWTTHESFDMREPAWLIAFKYIEIYCDSERIDHALDRQSPTQFEAERAPVQAAKRSTLAAVRNPSSIAPLLPASRGGVGRLRAWYMA